MDHKYEMWRTPTSFCKNRERYFQMRFTFTFAIHICMSNSTEHDAQKSEARVNPKKVNHLLKIDNLKPYEKNKELQALLQSVRIFTQDIQDAEVGHPCDEWGGNYLMER